MDYPPPVPTPPPSAWRWLWTYILGPAVTGGLLGLVISKMLPLLR